MKNIKKKYIGMKRDDLTKAFHALTYSMAKTRMTLLDNPKAHAEMVAQRYERALLKTLLQMPDLK